MATVSYTTAEVELLEVSNTVRNSVQRLSDAKATVTAEKQRLDALPTKYADLVTFINDPANQTAFPELKTKLDNIAADFNARKDTATQMETALAAITI